jgi:hypothetical protein
MKSRPFNALFFAIDCIGVAQPATAVSPTNTLNSSGLNAQ